MSEYLSTDPNFGLDDGYLSTDPNFGLEKPKKRSIASDVYEVGRQVGAGAVVDLPKMAGQSIQAFTPKGSTISEYGKEMAKNAEARAPGWEPDLAGRGGIAAAFIRGGRSVAPSVASLPAYAAGPVVGGLATTALFGGSQYTEEHDKMKAAGASDEDARNAGLITGGIQGGGEAIANRLTLGLFGAGKKVAAEGIKGLVGQTVDKSVIKPFAKATGAALIGEPATEIAQDIGTAAVERQYGLPTQGYGNIAYDSGTTALAMTALLAPFGLAGHYKNSKRAEAIDKTLSDPEVGKMQRVGVVNGLYSEAKKLNIPDADAWHTGAMEDIANGLPVRRTPESQPAEQAANQERMQRDLDIQRGMGEVNAGNDILPVEDVTINPVDEPALYDVGYGEDLNVQAHPSEIARQQFINNLEPPSYLEWAQSVDLADLIDSMPMKTSGQALTIQGILNGPFSTPVKEQAAARLWSLGQEARIPTPESLPANAGPLAKAAAAGTTTGAVQLNNWGMAVTASVAGEPIQAGEKSNFANTLKGLQNAQGQRSVAEQIQESDQIGRDNQAGSGSVVSGRMGQPGQPSTAAPERSERQAIPMGDTAHADVQRVEFNGKKPPATPLPASAPALVTQQSAVDAAQQWDTENRISREDRWFEGAHVTPEARDGFTEALNNGGSSLSAHGMAKETTLTGGIKNLLGLLTNGLDITRRNGVLDTAPLVSKAGEGMVGATASGSAYSDGPFILVARPGEQLSGNLSGLGAILINQEHADIAQQIAEAVHAIRPDIIVETYSGAGRVAQELNSQQHKKKRIDAEVASRQKASAENFVLGQGAEDALAGQGDIFSQPVKPTEKPAAQEKPVSFLTFKQWVEQVWGLSRYKDSYLENNDGNERLAKLSAATGGAADAKVARAKYFAELMALPRDTAISLDVFDALNDAEQRDAQRHFFDLDWRLTDRLVAEGKARVEKVKEQKQVDMAHGDMSSSKASSEAKRLTQETGIDHVAVNKEWIDADGVTNSTWRAEPKQVEQNPSGMSLEDAKAYVEQANIDRPFGLSYDEIERMQGGRITDKPKTGDPIAAQPKPLAQTQGQAQGAEGKTVEVSPPATTKPDEVSAFDQRYPTFAAAEQAIKAKKLKQVAVFKDGDQYRIGARGDKKQAPSTNLIQRIKQLGGIHTRYRADVIGDKAGAPGLFSNTGKGLDDLATALQAEGFAIDTAEAGGGVDALTGLIQRAVNSGETVLNYAGQQAAAEKKIADDFRDNLKEEIAKLGGNPARNASTQKLVEMLNSLRAQLRADLEQESIAKAAQLEAIIGKELTGAEWDMLLDERNAQAFDYTQDIAAIARMEQEREAANAVEREYEGEGAQAAGQRAGEGPRQGDSTGGGEPQAARTKAGQEDFGLTGETPEEIRAREEAQAAKEKAEADRAKADEQPFVMTGSNRAADELAARGQQDIFSQPVNPKATRSKPKTRIAFDGITGPTGAKLTGYEWAWKPYAYVDRLGEDREGRESDWDNAETNVETGRDIVHKFTVAQAGNEQTVSLETALQLLGFAEAGSLSVKSVANTAKRVAKIKMAIAELEPVADAYDKAKAEVDAMPYPPITVEGIWARMGDAMVRRRSDDAFYVAGEKKTLELSWKEKRMAERGFKGIQSPHDVIADLKAKLERAERKMAEAVKAAANAPVPAQKAPDSSETPSDQLAAKSITRNGDNIVVIGYPREALENARTKLHANAIIDKKGQAVFRAGTDYTALQEALNPGSAYIPDAKSLKAADFPMYVSGGKFSNARAHNFAKKFGAKSFDNKPEAEAYAEALTRGEGGNWKAKKHLGKWRAAKEGVQDAQDQTKAQVPQAQANPTPPVQIQPVVETPVDAPDGIQAEGDAGVSTADVGKAKQPTTPIVDIGEKIGGARKDIWTSYKNKLAEANEVDIKAEPLSKSWPAPDYDAMLEDGANQWAVAFMHAARDEIPTKPSSTWKLGRWVEQVKMLREFAIGLTDGTVSVESARREIAKTQALSDIASRVDLYMAVGHSKSLRGISMTAHSYSLYRGTEYKPAKVLWAVEQKAKATAFSNWPRELAIGETKEEALAIFKKKYAELDIDKPASKETKFEIYSTRGENGYRIGKKIGRNPILLTESFATVKEAREHMREHQDELVKKLEDAKKIPSVRRDSNEPRVGEDMRDGQDVTPQMFMEAFGFKGVEFGNWVEQKTRQKDLNDAYDALMDMAAVIGVKPNALSLNGELGLAFGARGKGGIDPAKAHYEADFIVINLTKKNGAGSLGHEWWHALDNYFERMRGKKGGYATEAMDVSLARRGSTFISNTAVRKEMVEAFGGVMRAIHSTTLKARSAKVDAKRVKDYWTTGHEMSARAYESYLISKLQDQDASNDYLANIVDEKTWAAAEKMGFELDGSYPYPTAGEVPAIRAAFDHFFQTIESKETDKGTALFSRRPSFFSPLAKAIQTAKQDTMPAPQWRLWLNGNKAKLGLKDDEIQFSGINEYLELRGKDKVTKAEIADYLRGIGGKVVSVDTEGGKQPGFSITQEVRENLTEQGLPLFARTNDATQSVPYTYTKASPEDQAAIDKLNSTLQRYFGNDKHGLVPFSGRDTDVSRAFSDEIRSLFKTRVIVVQPKSGSGLFNGFQISGLDAIFVDGTSDAGFIQIAGHELWHHIETTRPDLAKWYGEQAKLYIKDLPAYRNRLNSLLQQGEEAYTDAGAESELLADFLGDSLSDPDFLQRLASSNESKFKRLITTVRMWLGNLAYKMRGLKSSRHIGDVRALQTYLVKVLDAYAAGKNIGGIATPNFQRVWHGGPNLWQPEPGFPHGRPRLDKMGTGEGAQAFGWGFYTAQAMGVAVDYQRKLSDSKLMLDGVEVGKGRDVAGLAKTALGWRDGNIKATKDMLAEYAEAPSADAKTYRDTLAWIEENENGLVYDRGHLYQLDIPDDVLPYLLDWDKPLSEQTPEVKRALLPFARPTGSVEKTDGGWSAFDDDGDLIGEFEYKSQAEAEIYTDSLAHILTIDGSTGKEVYDAIRRDKGSGKAASEYLASIGIVGNRYLDGQSRNRPLKDIKREFLAELPEDADFDEVSELIGTGRFSPKNDALLKALSDDEWLGFDYPSQAISAALSKDLGNYDASPALLRAVADAQEGATFNFVIWDQPTLDKIALLERNGEKLDAMRDADVRMSRTGDPTNPDIRFSRSGQSAGRTQADPIWSAEPISKMDTFLYELQDKHIDTKRIIQAIQKQGKQISDEWNVYIKEALYHGRTAKKTEDFLTDEVKPAIELMAKHGISQEDMDEYLHARHAIERNRVMKERNPDREDNDGLSGMTDEDAKAILAKAKPGFKEAAKVIDSIIAKTRQELVGYGLEKQETVDSWAELYSNYVPLQREGFEDRPGTGMGFSVRGNSSKEATGSHRAVENILAHVAMQREKAIVRGEKNRVATALYGLAQQFPNSAFWKLDKPAQMTQINPDTGQVEVVAGDLADYKVPRVKYIGKDGTVKERIDPNYKGRNNVMTVRINGVDHAIIFNDQDARAMRMVESLKNLDADQLGEIVGGIGKVTRYIASMATQYNPVFGVINLIRDTQTAALNLSSTELKGKQGQVMKASMVALKGIYQDARAVRDGKHPSSPYAKLWEEFQATGGQTGYRDMFRTSNDRAEAIEKMLDPEWWQKGKFGKAITLNGILAKPEQLLFDKVGRKAFNWLSDYNLAMENAMRLGAYKVARDNGMSKDKSAFLAKNLTVNFNKKGKAATQAGALYAFFNASAQGTARIAETLHAGAKDGEFLGKTGKAIVYGGITLGAMNAIALIMAGFDDDEPPEFMRERNLIIPAPGTDKGYVSIPMPLGFHVLPNIGRVLVESAVYGKPMDRMTDLLMTMLESFNPIGTGASLAQTISPTVFDPVIAMAENKDWTGKNIYREDFNKTNPTPGFTRTKDSASAFSKGIAEAINTITGGTEFQPGRFSPTPDQIDYLIGQVTGGVGREITKVMASADSAVTGEELPMYKVPIAGRLVGTSSDNAAVRDRFYDNVRMLNMHEAEIKGRREKQEPTLDYIREHPETRYIRMATATETQVRNLQKRKRQMIEDGKRESVKLIDAQIAAKMKRLNDMVSNAKT